MFRRNARATCAENALSLVLSGPGADASVTGARFQRGAGAKKIFARFKKTNARNRCGRPVFMKNCA